MITVKQGRVCKGLGGLYEVRLCGAEEGVRLSCRAKGVLRRDEQKLLIGDMVTVTEDDSLPDGRVISEILPRRNALIRPPMANLHILFTVIAAMDPAPAPETVDKLTAIAVHNGIENVIVITKSDLQPQLAEQYAAIYRLAGFPVFVTSSDTAGDPGIAALSDYVRAQLTHGRTAAFAGASGVGKSTLMNTLFPSLSLATSAISQRIARGRHTTRHVELFDITPGSPDTGFLADTPGFSMLDFARFDFFELGELLPAFPDLVAHAHGCRYADCTHTGEGVAECAVARAAAEGRVAPSRLESYRSLYAVLKRKHSYDG